MQIIELKIKRKVEKKFFKLNKTIFFGSHRPIPGNLLCFGMVCSLTKNVEIKKHVQNSSYRRLVASNPLKI